MTSGDRKPLARPGDADHTGTLQMERFAADDDVTTCPICGGRDGLRIRWTPDDHLDPNQVTEVGCATCQKWIAASESHWAVARWNGFAIDAWKDKGVDSEHAELHRLLLNKAQLQEQAELAEKKIDEYLTRHIVPTCYGNQAIVFAPPATLMGSGRFAPSARFMDGILGHSG